jgi:hypothetical protein
MAGLTASNSRSIRVETQDQSYAGIARSSQGSAQATAYVDLSLPLCYGLGCLFIVHIKSILILFPGELESAGWLKQQITI